MCARSGRDWCSGKPAIPSTPAGDVDGDGAPDFITFEATI